MLFAAMLEGENLDRYWPMIEKSLSAMPEIWETTTLADIYERVTARRMQIWAVGNETEIELVFATQVVPQPAVKTLQVLVGFGKNLDDYWSFLLSRVEEIAKGFSCEEVEISTMRWGMVRKLQGAGYRIRNISVVKHVGSVQ